jgi:hypothetical protein
LFDEIAGFSALMKVFPRDPSTRAEVHAVRAPLLGLSEPDPMLAYPTGTVLHPRLFLRNASLSRLPVQLVLHWKGGSTTGNITAQVPPIEPEETRVIDLSSQQRGLPANANWANIELRYPGRLGDLVPVATSYDDTGRYGLQSPFSPSLSFMFKGGMWHVDTQHDTLMTTGNAGSKTAKVALSFFYGKTGVYEMPEKYLAPGDQMWVDVGRLIRTQIPDKNGKMIPPDTMSGSYEIKDLNDTNIGYLYEGKITTDKTFGPATYGCAPCCGYDGTYLTPDPMKGPVGGGGGFTVWATNNCTGQDVARGGAYNWASSNTSVATVNTSGYASYVGSGSSNASSYINLRIPGVNNCPAYTFSQLGPIHVGPYQVEILATASQGAANCPAGQAGWVKNTTNQIQSLLSKLAGIEAVE